MSGANSSSSSGHNSISRNPGIPILPGLPAVPKCPIVVKRIHRRRPLRPAPTAITLGRSAGVAGSRMHAPYWYSLPADSACWHGSRCGNSSKGVQIPSVRHPLVESANLKTRLIPFRLNVPGNGSKICASIWRISGRDAVWAVPAAR